MIPDEPLLQDTRTQIDRMRAQRWPEPVIAAYCEAAADYYSSRVRNAIDSALLQDWMVRS